MASASGALLLIAGVAMGSPASASGIPLTRGAAGLLQPPGVSLPPAPGPLAMSTSDAGTAAPRCNTPPLATTELRRIYSLPVPSVGGTPVRPHGAVDPAHSCITYRVLGDHVDRGVNGGGFVTVFQAGAPEIAPPRAPMSLAAPVFAGGTIYVYDEQGNRGIFASADEGAHWTERDGGLPLAAALPDTTSSTGWSPVTTIRTLVFARSQPRTGYALVQLAPGATVLYATGDGGVSWAPRAVPDVNPDAVAVDFFDPQVIFVTGAGTVADPGFQPYERVWTIDESPDGGRTWIVHPGPLSLGGVTAVAAMRTVAGADGVPVVEPGGVPTPFYLAPSQLNPSQVDGGIVLLNTWESQGAVGAVPVGLDLTWWNLTRGFITMEAASPVDPRRLDLAVAHGAQIGVVSSVDGFTRRYVALSLPAPDGVDAAVRTLETDAAGDIVVDVASSSVDDLYIFAPTAQRTLGTSLATKVDPTSTSGQPPSTSVPVDSPVRSCSLDPSLSHDASITFDGNDLDVADAPKNTIFRFDPRTCRMLTPIVLPAGATGGYVQYFGALTYDPDYSFADGATGAILALGFYDPRLPRGSQRYVPVYAVSPLAGHAVELAMSIAVPAGENASGYDKDPTAFTYDPAEQALWIARGDLRRLPAQRGAVGDRLDTCMGGVVLDRSNNQLTGAPYPQDAQSSWAAGADRTMFIQLEDDQSVYRVDTTTCTILSGFRHAVFSEAARENDQMACDAVTFAAGGTAVLWIRNSQPARVIAYTIPTGDCPYVQPPQLPPVSPPPVRQSLALLSLLPPPPPPLPAPVVEYQPAPLPEPLAAPAQSLAQSQAQSQASSQVNVGMVTQRQRQARVATTRLTLPQPTVQSQAMMATRTSAAQRFGGAGVVLTLLLGLPALRRRHAPARARIRPRQDA